MREPAPDADVSAPSVRPRGVRTVGVLTVLVTLGALALRPIAHEWTPRAQADPALDAMTAKLVALLRAPAAAVDADAGPDDDDDEEPAFPTASPLGLPAIPSPAHNPFTREAFELGRDLFTDPILSTDRSISCASCHRLDHGFSSSTPLPNGVHGRKALRHAPSLYNRAWARHHSWDGQHATLEEQVLAPISNPNEMGLPLRLAVRRIQRKLDYVVAFGKVYGKTDAESLGKALATFVRGLVYGGTPVDRFNRGERDALTPAERAGQWVYESKGQCWRCHVRPHFTDEAFHNTGVGTETPDGDAGRFNVTGVEADRGKFKTPTLRGLLETAPYMHDGSQRTLEDVVTFYRLGGNPNPNLDRHIGPLDLTDEEAKNLVAFLKALSKRPAKAADRPRRER